MNRYDYSELSLADLIAKLEQALDEIDDTLESLGTLPKDKRIETRLYRVADNVESVSTALGKGE